jgi:hypothetical protein
VIEQRRRMQVDRVEDRGIDPQRIAFGNLTPENRRDRRARGKRRRKGGRAR